MFKGILLSLISADRRGAYSKGALIRRFTELIFLIFLMSADKCDKVDEEILPRMAVLKVNENRILLSHVPTDI